MDPRAVQVAQRTQVRDRLGAIGQRHRQINQHTAPVVAPATLLRRRHRHRQRPCETNLIGKIAQQTGPHVANHTLAAGGHRHRWASRITLHLESAFLGGLCGVATNRIAHQEGAFAHPPTISQELLQR